MALTMNPRCIAQWLQHAQENRYAIGAFNANTLEQIQAIVWAAEIEKSPAILQVSHNALLYLGNGKSVLGLRYFHCMAKTAAGSVSMPVFVHLDHGTYHEVLWAIGLGYNSVMFDGSDLPFDENIRQTHALSRIAHSAGVLIEAELGEVPKPGGTANEEEGALTDPYQAKDFIEQTRVDSLAISIGSIHGGKKKLVRLDLALLRKIRDQVDVPLVLHGSSGVVDADLKKSIDYGISKVNTATQSNLAFSDAVMAYLHENPDVVDPRKYLVPARDEMSKAVSDRMKLLGSTGRAQA